jgi:transposase
MRKIKEVLRLKNELNLGQRQIARSCSVGLATVNEYLARAEQAGVGWPLPEGWEEAELQSALLGEAAGAREPERAAPDFAAIHQQRQTQRFVTLQLLWEEYRAANPDGYQYSRFCELYQRWRRRQNVVLRQEYKAGEKLFVDWAGPTIPIYSRTGGETEQAHLRRGARRQFLYVCRSHARRADDQLADRTHVGLRVLWRSAKANRSG